VPDLSKKPESKDQLYGPGLSARAIGRFSKPGVNPSRNREEAVFDVSAETPKMRE
jgi:hypothetical protein